MADEIRIVVADDHVLAREGMRRLLGARDGMTVVAEAVDGVETLDVVERLHPDVLVLDVRMPRINGIEVTRHLRENSSRTRILVVSAYHMDAYVLPLLEAGADGYMTKTSPPDQLTDAVERVHRGECVLHSDVAQRMAGLWARRRMMEDEPGKKLTGRQLHVLQLAARGWRNKAIAVELDIGVRTVQGHLSNVYCRLNVSSRMQAVLHTLPAGPAEVGRNGQIGRQIRPPAGRGVLPLAVSGARERSDETQPPILPRN